METELIILCVVLVLSVVAHYFFWRDGKRRYDENMKQIEALNKKLMQLEANDEDIDKMLDEADKGLQKMGNEIDALRSVWFMNRKKRGVES